MIMDWHAITLEEVISRLGCDRRNGLNAGEAAWRLKRDGRNELPDHGTRGAWPILRAQIASTMLVLLVVAASVSALLRDFVDAGAILAILIVNIALGFFQEHRADRSIAALRKLAVPRCKVIRSGSLAEVDPAELVAGDLIPLEAGARVPADGRLVEAAALRAEESSLTGESAAVDKDVGRIGDLEAPVGDRRNMVFLGTMIVAGRGLAVVTAAGMSTELGRIAQSLLMVCETQTPLQRRLEQMSRGLGAAAVGVVLVFFAVGLLLGEAPRLMFLTAVSMAVAAVPEGLPTVIIAALAIAARKMLARNALVRKLTAVESLGSVTVICCDKTGTLTENLMVAAALYTEGGRVAVQPGKTPQDRPSVLLLAAGALCNDAHLTSSRGGHAAATGDPTEAALVVAAADYGLPKPMLEKAFPRVDERPFDSGRKTMSTVHSVDIRKLRTLSPELTSAAQCEGVIFVKGSVESLLPACSRIQDGETQRPMAEETRQRILSREAALAAEGMRVIGVAWRPLDDATAGGARDREHDLIFIGMAGLADPPRSGVKQAVGACREAGIRVAMITGDHPLTAASVARELGIALGKRILTGRELMSMPDRELERIAEDISIYARVSPEHKLKIVSALKARGHIVAMTGDGVNDAPALKSADIGVAMGITGTDVAKQAAAMVLLDDRFPTIVAAVREGRVVYDNIRKFLKFLMTTNAGELMIMLVAPALGMPLALTPIQILWVNLLTDGLPALALSFEDGEADVMERPPRPPQESLFNGRMLAHIAWVGTFMASLALLSGWTAWKSGEADWQSELLTVLVLTQMAHVLAIRSEHSWFSGRRSGPNGLLLAAVALTAALQAAILYIPALRFILGTAPLSWTALSRVLACASAVYAAVELEKAAYEHRPT